MSQNDLVKLQILKDKVDRLWAKRLFDEDVDFECSILETEIEILEHKILNS